MCNITLKAEARKPSLGSGFMTSLKLVHQGGLQTFGGKKKKKEFVDPRLLQDVPNRGKKRRNKKRRERSEQQKETQFNTILMELFDIFLNGKNSL